MQHLLDENTILSITPTSKNNSVHINIYLKLAELHKIIHIVDSLQLDEFTEKYPLSTKYVIYVPKLEKHIQGSIISLQCKYYKSKITRTIQFYLDRDNAYGRLITINADDTDLFSLVQPT